MPHRSRVADSSRIELAGVDAAVDDVNALARGAVALVNEVGGELRVGDDNVAARHHAVVEPFERALLGIGAMVGGHERQPPASGSNQCAPRRRATPGVQQRNAALPDQDLERARVGKNAQRVLGRGGKSDDLAAALRHHRRQPSTLGRDQRCAAAAHDGIDDFER
jgi:hypothetical protein